MNVTLRPAPPLPAMTREQFLDWNGHIDGHWEFDGVPAHTNNWRLTQP